MKLDPGLGDHISTVAAEAVALVASGEPEVTFDFNDIIMTVKPGMSAGDVVAEYSRESHARHEAYIASPEYKARQLEAEEREHRRTTARDAALASAPAAMSLRDPEGWAKAQAANADPYGGAVMIFAETWARLMEGAISSGATVAGCAKEMSHLADMGITGFMYGAAVSTLAAVWTHGEELRRWHNLDTQIKDEGDRANETGGVLNPAILSIG